MNKSSAHGSTVCSLISDVNCSQSTPDLPHSTKTENETHVTYVCEANYSMSDGKMERTFPCECAAAAKLHECNCKTFYKIYIVYFSLCEKNKKHNICNHSLKILVLNFLSTINCTSLMGCYL